MFVGVEELERRSFGDRRLEPGRRAAQPRGGVSGRRARVGVGVSTARTRCCCGEGQRLDDGAQSRRRLRVAEDYMTLAIAVGDDRHRRRARIRHPFFIHSYRPFPAVGGRGHPSSAVMVDAADDVTRVYQDGVVCRNSAW